jgi:hypothetical protein
VFGTIFALNREILRYPEVTWPNQFPRWFSLDCACPLTEPGAQVCRWPVQGTALARWRNGMRSAPCASAGRIAQRMRSLDRPFLTYRNSAVRRLREGDVTFLRFLTGEHPLPFSHFGAPCLTRGVSEPAQGSAPGSRLRDGPAQPGGGRARLSASQGNDDKILCEQQVVPECGNLDGIDCSKSRSMTGFT